MPLIYPIIGLMGLFGLFIVPLVLWSASNSLDRIAKEMAAANKEWRMTNVVLKGIRDRMDQQSSPVPPPVNRMRP